MRQGFADARHLLRGKAELWGLVNVGISAGDTYTNIFGLIAGTGGWELVAGNVTGQNYSLLGGPGRDRMADEATVR